MKRFNCYEEIHVMNKCNNPKRQRGSCFKCGSTEPDSILSGELPACVESPKRAYCSFSGRRSEISSAYEVPVVLQFDEEDEVDFIQINAGLDTVLKIGRRHEQILLLFFLIFMDCCTKVDMSVCIVAMTDPTVSPNEDIRTYNWTNKSLVVSAFIWGYMWPQALAGWLANRYGPKWFLISAMTTCSLIGLLLPAIADEFGSSGVMVCRALQGLCHGWLFPSVQALLGKWVPRNERSILGSFVHSGSPTGVLVGILGSGYIASSWYGWPMVFFVFYSTMMLWCFLFAYFGSNSPAVHPKITNEERLYIESSLNQEEYSENLPTPWKKILTSVPFWALIITQTGYSWGYWTLMADIPMFMNYVMKFNLESNGVVSSLPYLLQWISAFFFSVLSDLLINKQICSTGTTRKLMNMIGEPYA
ncbi:hypothetical protein JTB14_038488 [Gonioctena quinquepunctata]|nr:hypothetical protein JTB14_038488 [Gonioctena quinquepunctata]